MTCERTKAGGGGQARIRDGALHAKVMPERVKRIDRPATQRHTDVIGDSLAGEPAGVRQADGDSVRLRLRPREIEPDRAHIAGAALENSQQKRQGKRSCIVASSPSLSPMPIWKPTTPKSTNRPNRQAECVYHQSRSGHNRLTDYWREITRIQIKVSSQSTHKPRRLTMERTHWRCLHSLDAKTPS